MRYAPPPPPRRRPPPSGTEPLRRLIQTSEARRDAEEKPFDPGAPREVYAQPHHFSVNARAAAADAHAATELVMFIENEADLSPDGPSGQGHSVLLNALRKWRKGAYDPVLGVRLFEYLTETGAKRYAREFDHRTRWAEMFNPATRREAARQLEESFRASVERGEYDGVDTRVGR